MRISGNTTSSTALGDMMINIKPTLSKGGGQLYIPVADWGVRFKTFLSPVVFEVVPKNIDRQEILKVASGDQSVIASMKRDIINSSVKTAIKTSVIILSLVLILSFSLTRMNLSYSTKNMISTVVAGVLTVIAFLLLGILTYSSSSLSEPEFYARGEELSQLLDVIQREKQSSQGSYQDNFSRTLIGISSFLSDRKGILPESNTFKAVLYSDLHSNALAIPALDSFSRDKVVFFVGDFGIDGNEQEADILIPRIASLGKRVIAVSGNHDSSNFMLSLARSGVQVVGKKGVLNKKGQWVEKDVKASGLRIAGWDDPMEWSGDWPSDPSRKFSLPEKSDTAEEEAKQSFIEWWNGLTNKPDILLVHQSGLAKALMKRLTSTDYPRPLTILTGHDHKQWIYNNKSLNIVDAGSAGAGGVFGLGSEDAQVAELYFNTKDKNLDTVDMVKIDPIRGGASAKRIIPDEDCKSPCKNKLP